MRLQGYSGRVAGLMLMMVCAVASAQVVVQTSVGKLQGIVKDGVASFKGVPYAQPPIGDLRLRAPLPVKSWSGIRKAEQFSAGCIQHKDIERLPWSKEYMLQGPISEDCLYLNVWTPAGFDGKKLPVYVYFHGGGLVEGAGSLDVYDGANLARKGLVVVTVNYRLGPLGFMAHPALSAESPHHVSGNYGFLDSIASLQWVKSNIASFGGDASKVTVGGQSAGSGIVHDLCASPLATGLFRAAVAESGTSLIAPALRPLAEAEKDGADFAASLHASSAAEIRKLPAEAFIPAPGSARLRFTPVVDGWSMPDTRYNLSAIGKTNDVPLFTGMQHDENAGNATYGTIPAEEWHKQVQKVYGDLASKFNELYPSPDDAAAAVVEKQSLRDRAAASMYLFCTTIAAHQKSKVYMYYFNRAIPWPGHPEFGAFHTGEMVYILANLDKVPRPFTDADRRVANTMSGYLVNFVRSGDPNGPNVPKWSAFTAEPPSILEVADPTTGMRPLLAPEKLAFWREFFDSPTLVKNATPSL